MQQMFNHLHAYLASLNKPEDVEWKIADFFVFIELYLGRKSHNRNMQMRSDPSQMSGVGGGGRL